ncbi:MAG: 30S ribosomal protein THX [Bacteroidetes bacterium]|nr:30S ribosomal protein THX [Bacteroidota bacterium]
MGKGDQRTKRGKIFRGTYGKSRPKKRKKRALKAAQQEASTPTS